MVARIVVCTKQVLDPDALNAYAIAGRLTVDGNGRGFQADITRIMNAYDEQAIEAALRLRDAGLDCTITAVAAGDEDVAGILRHALAMGCDEAVLVTGADLLLADGMWTARLLAAAIEARGGADLVLCGRQGSDYDQGVVPAAIAELLGTAYVTLAADVRIEDGSVTVRRVTALGEEVVRATLPATVTVSNELGTPRYPTVSRPPPSSSRLEDARVIVSGGRGLGDATHYALIEDLAAALHGMPGASRAIVDLGWAKPERQVGLTGKTVAPDLYIAAGISGASQHIVGCSNSRVIVALNTDPEAPIFRHAHYGIVGDALQVLPELIRLARTGES